MEITVADEERFIILAENVVDSGWRRRPDGSWSRLLKFSEPIPEDLYNIVVMVYYITEVPQEMLRTQTKHKERLSIDRRMLHLHAYPAVRRHQPPVPQRTPAPTNRLFGSPGMAFA